LFSAKEEDSYSLIGTTSIKNNSDDEDNFDLAAITPQNGSVNPGKNEFFKKYDDDSSSGPYCLVGEDVPSLKYKKSVKQKRTSNNRGSVNSNIVIQDEIGGMYTEISSNALQPKPTCQPSSDSDCYTKMRGATMDSIYQTPPRGNDIYQYPSSSSSFHKLDSVGSDIPPPSPATAQEQVMSFISGDSIYGVPVSSKQRSQTMPVNIGSPTDNYDNVNLQSTPSTECYDNVQLRSCSTENYDNVQLTNSPAENYDNVNIKNKESSSVNSDSYYQHPPVGSFGSSPGGMFYQENTSNSGSSSPRQQSSSFSSNQGDDMYYQAPPTSFKTKPQPIRQSTSQPQQYTSVKTKSMKQKRTATIVKRDIDLSDSPPQQTKQESPLAVRREKEMEEEPLSIVDNEKKVQQAKELMLAQANLEDNTTRPVPKPRVKQSRTSEKRVESGYRMKQTTENKPLNETYEWSKVFY